MGYGFLKLSAKFVEFRIPNLWRMVAQFAVMPINSFSTVKEAYLDFSVTS